MLAGRPVRICREASSTTAPAIANASCGEAKRGAAPRSWSRRLSSSMYCATASSARSRRAIARGPAPTISTSSVCASSGNCSSAAEERLGRGAHALGGVGVDAALAGRAHRAEDHLDRGVEQGDDAVLLVVEVLVEGGLRHPGLARDRLRGRLAVADAREHGGGGREQPAALQVLADLERRGVAAAGGRCGAVGHGSRVAMRTVTTLLARCASSRSPSSSSRPRARRLRRRPAERLGRQLRGRGGRRREGRSTTSRRSRDPERDLLASSSPPRSPSRSRPAAATAPTRSTRCCTTSATRTCRSATSRSPGTPPAPTCARATRATTATFELARSGSSWQVTSLGAS